MKNGAIKTKRKECTRIKSSRQNLLNFFNVSTFFWSPFPSQRSKENSSTNTVHSEAIHVILHTPLLIWIHNYFEIRSLNSICIKPLTFSLAWRFQHFRQTLWLQFRLQSWTADCPQITHSKRAFPDVNLLKSLCFGFIGLYAPKKCCEIPLKFAKKFKFQLKKLGTKIRLVFSQLWKCVQIPAAVSEYVSTDRRPIALINGTRF